MAAFSEPFLCEDNFKAVLVIFFILMSMVQTFLRQLRKLLLIKKIITIAA